MPEAEPGDDLEGGAATPYRFKKKLLRGRQYARRGSRQSCEGQNDPRKNRSRGRGPVAIVDMILSGTLSI